MLQLALYIVLLFVVVGATTFIFRKIKGEKMTVAIKEPEECCGAHEVCEKDSLLNNGGKLEYYNDEELDTLAGISPLAFTEKQLEELEHVFYTLQEADVAGWLRSLHARNIQLPSDLREEALLIVSERRSQ